MKLRKEWAAELHRIDGGRYWTLQDFESELLSEGAQLFAWSRTGASVNSDPAPTAPAAVDSAATKDSLAALNWDGFVLYRIVYEEAWVMNLAVRVKGQGWGKGLLLAFENYLVAHHAQVSEIGLEVAALNVSAWRLYESQSFALVGGRKNYYKNGDDARVYKKLLLQNRGQS